MSWENKMFLLLWAFALACGVNSVVIPVSSENTSLTEFEKTPKALTYLGVADGVAFFAEQTTWKTWQEAYSFCAASGLQLATILTRNQIELLNKSPLQRTGCAWTSAKNSMRITMLTWDNGQHPDASLFAYYTPIIDPHLICGNIYFSPQGAAGFDTALCSRGCHTICQARM